MVPAYANFGGKIHGGILLSLMDKVAYACAAKHAGRYCVTVSVDEVNFRAPVEVGDLLSLKASVNYVGNTSMVIGIRVEAQNVTTGEIRHTNTSYFTMVAKDPETGKPSMVPPLLLETKEDIRRFQEAMLRKSIKAQNESMFDNRKQPAPTPENLQPLTLERVRIRTEHLNLEGRD